MGRQHNDGLLCGRRHLMAGVVVFCKMLIAFSIFNGGGDVHLQ
ncbi:hypothetical protein DCWBC2_0254 [Dehalococcoides mccartyi]|nr:hypothetical protein DCWBC2_0254 [Dehalococcoides mccartyi]